MTADLPEDIWCHILSLLPTKDAVATTVLSKKWTNLLTCAPFHNLQLIDGLPFPPKSCKHHRTSLLFTNFVNYVLRLIDKPRIRKLTLFCSKSYDKNLLNSWLLTSCTSHIVEVDLRMPYTQNPIELPQVLYISRSLLVLKLQTSTRLEFPPDCVCFPSLKVLWIKVYSQDSICLTEKLFHIRLVLEDLFIMVDLLNKQREVVMVVKSNTLRRLKIECLVHSFHGDIEYSFVVDCPNVERLDLCDDFLAKYNIAANLKHLNDAKICIGHPSVDYGKFEHYFEVKHSNRAFELLESLSNVKSLSLSGSTIGAVSYSYENMDSDDNEEENALRIRLRNFTLKFPFLTRLELDFWTDESWNFLFLLLRCCPNLQHLILRKELSNSDSAGHNNRFYYTTPPESVPECLLLHLQKIEIWRFDGLFSELAMIEFFLGHAEVLQKMTIHVQELTLDTESIILESPKLSDGCLVELK